MNDLSIFDAPLPANIEDLSRFVLIASDKLAHVKAELSAIKHAKLANEVVEQKKKETQELAKVLLLAQAKLGEFTSQIPKQSGGDRKSEKNQKFLKNQ